MPFYPVSQSLRQWGAQVVEARVVGMNLSQSDFEKRFGILQSFLSRLECGRLLESDSVSPGTLEKLRQVAQAVNLPLPAEYAEGGKLEPLAKRTYTVRSTRTGRPTMPRKKKTATKAGRTSKALLNAVLGLVASGKLAQDDAMGLIAIAEQ
jgi:transcriptional regulator with XRE-family HTH domain